VAKTGEIINIPDAYADKRFNPETDKRTRLPHQNHPLCAHRRTPKAASSGSSQVLNKKRGIFDASDEEVLLALADRPRWRSRTPATILRPGPGADEKRPRVRPHHSGRVPAPGAAGVAGWEFASQYQAAQEVAAILYDFILLSEKQMGVADRDVFAARAWPRLYTWPG